MPDMRLARSFHARFRGLGAGGRSARPRICPPLLLLLAVTSLLMTGTIACAEETITDEPDAPSEGQVEQEPEKSERAMVGDSITLSGNEEGLEMEVTVMAVQDPARNLEQFTSPRKGSRFVGIQLNLENVGGATYADSPTNGAALIDSSGQGHDATFATLKTEFNSNLRIQPGASQVGFIPFEIPRRAKLATFQFTLESGFGPETGEWTL
jgi:hypothetical protein